MIRAYKETWLTVKQMMDHMRREGHFEARRREQQRRAFEKLTELSIFEYVMQKLGRSGDVDALMHEVNAGTINEFAASLQIIDKLGQLTMD